MSAPPVAAVAVCCSREGDLRRRPFRFEEECGPSAPLFVTKLGVCAGRVSTKGGVEYELKAGFCTVARKARRISRADWKRSSGRLANALMQMASSSGCTSRNREGGGGS